MQQIQIDAYEEADIEAMIDAKVNPLIEWGNNLTDVVNELSANLTAAVARIDKQAKRINTLASRVANLEHTDTYKDTY